MLIALLWVVFFIVQGIFARNISHHEQFIPSHATSVVKIESEALIQALFQEVILNSGLDSKVRNYLDSPSEEEEEPIGIDFLSTIYLFTIQDNNCQLMGVLMNLSDEEQFNAAYGNEAQTGIGHASKQGAGILLFDNNDTPLSSKILNEMAQKMLEQPSSFDQTKLAHPEASITLWKKEYTLNNGTRSFQEIQLALLLERERLILDGTADFNYDQARSYPVLKRQDLSIQSQFVPNGLNDIWTTSMKKVGINFPRITYISGNYHYSEPSPVPELKILPHFDGIYGFESGMQIRVPLIALAATGDIKSLDLNSFEFGGKIFHYKQINPQTIYLGQSPYSLAATQDDALLKIEGNLKQLLEIRNGGMLSKVLALSPEYAAAQRFLTGVETSNFSIQQTPNGTADIDGEIVFEKNKSALNETMLLLFNLGLFD